MRFWLTAFGSVYTAAIAAGSLPLAQLADSRLHATTRAQVLEQSLQHVRERYVFPEVGGAMERAVRTRIANKEYDRIDGAAAFAEKLTADLQAVSRDKHLRVQHSEADGDRHAESGAPTTRRESASDSGRDDFGFRRVERLDGNIGYIDLRSFSPATLAGGAAAEAMNTVADADALIIDLRQNGGGDPAMVALMVSYLIKGEPLHLNDFVGRDGAVLQQFWTSREVPGKRFAGKDVYVLTSGRTFSAAEEFAYNLTNLKRATLIGETTGGGANPVTFFPLGNGFRISVPTGRARSPITQTNWEGVGVTPDIAVPAKLALQTAHLAALTKLAEQRRAETSAGALSAVIERVRRELEEMKVGAAS